MNSSATTTRLARLGLLTLVVAGLAAGPAAAQVTGLNYTVSGVGSYVFWADEAGLDDGYLYGAEVGLGFGEALELSGLYVLGNGFDTDFAAFTDDDALRAGLRTLPTRNVDLRRYGARLRLNVGKLRFNLGRGKVVPFISAGTGLLRFDPDGLDRSEVIYVDGNVGFAVALADRYTLTLAAENVAYRYSPGTLFFSDDDLAALGLTPARFEDQTVYNPAMSASLKIYLGGRDPGELTDIDRALQQQFGARRFRLSLEPFYGQIDFNDALDFPESQALVGLAAGFDLGEFVGLRAFYWKATNESSMLEDGLPDDTYDLQLYGGEINLGFGREFARGITPSLLLGAGYADVGEDYGEQTGVRPESRYFAIGGVGVTLPISSSLTLHGGVRSLFMSTENVEDLSEPSNVFGSLMYSAGVSFHLGGSGGRTAGEAVGGAIASADAGSRERDAALERELARLQARLDSLETAPARPADPAVAAQTAPMPLLRADTLVVDGDTTVVMRETQPAGPAPYRSNLSGQTITVPVPEQGEIYIRFGEPEAPRVETVYAPPTVITLGGGGTDSTGAAGLSAEQIRILIREEIAALAPQGNIEALTPEEFAANLSALEGRLEQRLAQESEQLRGEMRRTTAPPVQDDQPADVQPDDQGGGLLSSFAGRELEAVSPYVGFRVSEGPSQGLVGVRAHFRFADRRLRFMPELGLGFGDGTSINAVANVVLPLAPSGRINPYVGTGVGLLSDAGVSGLDLALNVLGGAEYTLANGMTLFGEFSTLDFLDYSRVLVGYRIRL